MKNQTLLLLKLMLKNRFLPAANDSNSKSRKSGKIFLYTLLGIYFGCYFAYIFYSILSSSYSTLALWNKTEYFPLVNAYFCFAVLILFGITTAAVDYYSGYEDFMFSLPLKQNSIVLAKALYTSITEGAAAFMLLICGAVVYTINSAGHINLCFYLSYILLLPLLVSVTSFIIYGLFILLLNIFPFLRKKLILNILAFGFAIIFSLLITYSIENYSTLSGKAGGTAALLRKFVETADSYKTLNIINLAAKGNILCLLAEALVSALIIFVLFPFISKFYFSSLKGFEKSRSKTSSSEKVQKSVVKTKTRGIVKALYFRDVKNLLREPAFALNCVSGIFFMPLLMLLSTAAGFIKSGLTLSALRFRISTWFLGLSFTQLDKIVFYAAGILSAVIIAGNLFSFTGSSCISREGKGISSLKALPVTAESIFKAKFFHALTYYIVSFVFYGIVFFAASLVLKLPFSIKEICFILVLSLVETAPVAILLIFIQMFIDTWHPKLNWDSPAVAVKQNIFMLLSFTLETAAVTLAIALFLMLPKTTNGALILAAIFVILAAPAGSLYFKYALKKWNLL